MIFVKILALLFGSIVISKTLIDYKRKEENWRMFLFWLIIWSAVVIVAFNPAAISEVLSKLSDKSITIGQIVGIGFVFILYVVYRVYLKANRLERQLGHLIRRIALGEVKNRPTFRHAADQPRAGSPKSKNRPKADQPRAGKKN